MHTHHATTAATTRAEDILRAADRTVADRITADHTVAGRTAEARAEATVVADHMDRAVVVIHPAAADIAPAAAVEAMVAEAAVIVKLKVNN